MPLKFDGDKITFGDNTTLNSANIPAHNHDDRYYTETEINAFQSTAQTNFNSLQNLVNTKINASEAKTNYITSLGTVSGSRAIDYDPTNRSIQTLILNGTATTLTKGTGWPTLSNSSVDVVLKITVSSATSITWSIVNEWYSQPAAGALSVGTHLFLLRAIGSSVVEGHYIGIRTN